MNSHSYPLLKLTQSRAFFSATLITAVYLASSAAAAEYMPFDNYHSNYPFSVRGIANESNDQASL